MWARGDVIVERHVRAGQVRWGYPMRVWHDDGERTVAFMPIGTTYQGMVGADGEPTRVYGAATQRVDRTWKDNHVLITRVEEEFAIYVFFDANWAMRAWYVNFQEPVRRYAHGLETCDLALDLLIAPDLSRHLWKDEDEFEERIAAGLYTRNDMERLKCVGRGVLEAARERRWPFDQQWQHWRPKSDWSLPYLVSGWDAMAGQRDSRAE